MSVVAQTAVSFEKILRFSIMDAVGRPAALERVSDKLSQENVVKSVDLAVARKLSRVGTWQGIYSNLKCCGEAKDLF